MPSPLPPRPSSRMFETRTHTWREAGLVRQITPAAVKRARVQALVTLPLFGAIIALFDLRGHIFGFRPSVDTSADTASRIITVLALAAVGWTVARNVGRAAGPWLFRRMDPGTAGTVGFLLRLFTVVAVLLVAANIAGLSARTIAVGGSITAVVIGLAAQQTLGNFFAGTVLLSARPFRVGERVRLQGGGLAGQIEGVVSSLGLLYTVFAAGEDSIMVPNSVVLNVAIMPLREPESVNLRARLSAGVTPEELQARLAETVDTPLRDLPQITLEEFDGSDVVVRIEATPQIAADGPQLAAEVISAVSRETRGEDQKQ